MSLSQRNIAALLLMAGACLTTQAQTIKLKLAPGLWEESTTTQINGQNVEEMMRKQMEKAMAQMTPEQKAQMQKTVAGMNHAGTHQTCLTPEQVAKGVDIDSVKDKLQKNAHGCSMNIISASENGAKFDMVCAQPNGNTSKSTGEYLVKSDREWSFKFNGSGVVNAADAKGATVTNKMQISGEVQAHWKASSCGNVLPTE